MKLSCLNNVKRQNASQRPPVPPAVVLLDAVVDRSGSMGNLAGVPDTGIRDFIAQHKKLPKKTKVRFSLTTFDNTAQTYYDAVDLHTMADISAEKMQEMVQPRGTTLLVDTVMKRLHSLERQLAKEIALIQPSVIQLKPKIVAILVVLTDGADNESRLFTANDLNKRITAARKKGISVVFLAANQDAIKTGATFGVQRGAALTFGANPAAATAAFASATQNVYRCASGGAAYVPAFTQLQRDSSAAHSAPAARPVPPRPAVFANRQAHFQAATALGAAIPPVWRQGHFQTPPRAGGGASQRGQSGYTPPPIALVRNKTTPHT